MYTLEGSITFNFTYNDVVNTTGNGFDDSSLGATRRSTVDSVATYLNTVLDHNGTIDFLWSNSQTDGSGFLASAGSLYFTNTNSFEDGLVFKHATTGIDPSAGTDRDGEGIIDFGYSWNSDIDDPKGSEFDLFTVVLHEITHALGFNATITSDGGFGISGTRSRFDSFLEDGSGNKILSNATVTADSNDLIGNSVVFTGANAVAANGNVDVPIYSPTPFDSGSSLSHFSTGTLAGSNAVMVPTIASGIKKRELSPIVQAVLKDLGYTFVPESSSYTLALSLIISGCILFNNKLSLRQN